MSELCKQSMKRLTQQVMQADLASRKNRMTTSKSFYFGALFLTSPAYYILYVYSFFISKCFFLQAQYAR